MPTQLEQVRHLIDAGNWDAALHKARRLAKRDPTRHRVHALLSRIGLASGRPAVTVTASRHLAGLIEMNYWQLNRWVIAAARLGDAIEFRVALRGVLRRAEMPADRLPHYFQLAANFGDEQSMTTIRRRSVGPERALIAAMELQIRGDSGAALGQLDSDIEAHPGHGMLRVERGRLRLRRGDGQGARDDFEAALNLGPATARLRQLHNSASLISEPDDELERYLVSEMEGEQPTAFVFSLRVEQLMVSGDAAGALEAIDHGLRIHPKHLPLRTSKPLALAEIGQFDEAVSAAAELVESEAPNAELLLVEAQVHRAAGTKGRQLTNLNHALALHELVPLESTAPDDNLSPQFLRAAETPPVSAMTDHITVIMTAFGQNDLLPRAIDSILQQTHESLELIVVDDCSPDGTFDYLQERARSDSRLRPFQTPQNGGTYRAKNLGLIHSRGEFVAFMDSDDYSHPQRLEVQLREFKKNPDLALVSHWHLRIDDNSNILFKRGQALRLAHISPLIPRAVVDTVGYFDRVRVGADSEYIRRIQSLFGAENHLELKSPLMIVASHAGSLTGGGPFQMSWRGSGKVRMQYSSEFLDWHARIRRGDDLGYLPFQPLERPFPAPDLMLT